MALLGTIATGVYALGFPWNLLVAGLIVWGTLKLSGYATKLVLMTTAIALMWNEFTPDSDYSYLDLGMNAVAAHFALEVV